MRKKSLVHSIELIEFYLGPPCSMFGPLSERIVAGNTRIQTQDILRNSAGSRTTMTKEIFWFIPDQLFLDLTELLIEKILVSMRGELILQSDIIPLVSCQYSNSDTKQSISHFDENESNSSLHNIRKYFIYCIHFKVTYDILLNQRVAAW